MRVHKALARAALRRFRSHFRDPGGIAEDGIFSTFSISYLLGILALAGGITYLLLRSEAVVPPFIVRWVELFRIREIFAFDPLDESLIRRVYHILVLLVLAVVGLRLLLALVRSALGALALLPDRLLVVESNLLRSRIRHIPYDRILHLSADETIVQKILGLGYVEVSTGERPAPLRFGPIPGFPAFIARLAARMQKP